MLLELKLRKIGNSVGVVLPEEALAHLKVQEGDTVCVTEASDDSLRMSPASPDVTRHASLEATRQLEAAQDLVHRYRNALLELDT